MHNDGLMPDHRRELENGEERGRQDATEVEVDANLVPVEGAVVIALARGRTVSSSPTAVTAWWRAEDGKVEVHETGKSEAEEGTSEDEPQYEVVGLAETKRVIDATRFCVERVAWGTGWDRHCGG